MASRHRWTALAAFAATLALPSQPAAQDLFGLFWGSEAPPPRRPAAGYAVSRSGSSGTFLFSPFGMLFSPFQPQARPEPQDRGAYRTLCVRMCDGYYFPISHATSSAGLTRDAQRCAAACGGDARLFYHANPGGDVETMQDLTGRAYASYPTAFKYRRTLVQGCQCRPQPWTEAELARHRAYAAPQKGPAEAAATTAEAPATTDDLIGVEQDAVVAPAPIDRRRRGDEAACEPVMPPRPTARPKPRPKPAQRQGWDWLSGSGPPSAPRSSYAWSGAR